MILKRALASFLADRSGASAPFALIMTPALLGFVGLAVDTAALRLSRSEMQTLAEAAALAAATGLPNTTTAQDRALAIVTANGAPTNAVQAADIQFGTWANGAFTDDAGTTAVRVVASRTQAKGNAYEPSVFMGLFGYDAVDVAASAVATGTPSSGGTCMLLLHPNTSEALVLDSNASIAMNGCGVHVNSSSSSAVRTKSNSSIKVSTLKVVGGVDRQGSSTISPTAQTAQTSLADPYAALPAPTVPTTCTRANNFTVTSNRTFTSGEVFCGLKIDSNAVVTFGAGTYIFRGSNPFEVLSNARINGTDVFFYFAGTSRFFFDSNSTINLSAPTTGTRPGILFMAPSSNTQTSVMNSNSAATVNGAIYMPGQTLTFDSNSTMASSSPCFRLVVRRASFNSNSGLNLPAPGSNCGNNFGGSAGGVKLVR